MKIIVQIIFILVLSLNTKAQNASVEEVNAIIYPTVLTSSDSLDDYFGSTVEFAIRFKIDGIAQASKIFITIGSTDGGSETASLTYDVSSTSGTYYLEAGNDSFEVYSGYVQVSFNGLTANSDDFRYAEIWVEDSSQNLSTKEKFVLP